jgi:predicted GNAT family acetyltransferase
MATKALVNVLENTIWQALTSEHDLLSVGDDLARRYYPDISPLAGLSSVSDEAFVSLSRIVQSGQTVFVFLNEAPVLPSKASLHWEIKTTFTIDQMVCESFIPPESMPENIETLTDADVPEMLALTKLTNPGPFEPRTNAMGQYFGIKQDGRLAAMAGERLNLANYTEVSAVCTHPDFRGHGYAKALVAKVSMGILENNKTPILHTLSGNASAIRVYESLGFQKSRLVHFAILSHKAP